jgi:threonine dehydrogenase-like Zn-dependent dehydrogenase
VPDGLDDVTAALTEPFAVGLHAFEETDIADGQRIVVVGFGTIGAAVAWWANQRGALVTVVEPSDQRRAVAGALGFGDSLDPDSVDVRKEIRDRTRGEGADAVVDCTGAPGLLGTSLELLRRRGILVLTSVTSGVTEIDPKARALRATSARRTWLSEPLACRRRSAGTFRLGTSRRHYRGRRSRRRDRAEFLRGLHEERASVEGLGPMLTRVDASLLSVAGWPDHA